MKCNPPELYLIGKLTKCEFLVSVIVKILVPIVHSNPQQVNFKLQLLLENKSTLAIKFKTQKTEANQFQILSIIYLQS